jgi:kinetochore protein Nuf2
MLPSPLSIRTLQIPAAATMDRKSAKDTLLQPDTEIATCISEIGIPFTIDDLRKPNPQFIQKLFEHFANILMDATRDTVAPAMRSAASDIVGPDADRLYAPDVRDLMGFFIMLRRLLVECNIDDFTFADLYKPTHARLQKILSYIINFIRFRESHTGTIDKHFEEGERTKLRVQQLYGEKEALEQRLLTLQSEKRATELANAKKEEQYEDLKRRLRELDRTKDNLKRETEDLDREKERLIQVFEDRAVALETAREEAAKLKPYSFQKPEALESSLRDLSSKLSDERAQIETLDRRTRALQTSSDSFAAVALDISAVNKLLSDLASDLAKEEEEAAKAAKHRDALSERVSSVEDVERQERLLQKQLDSINARTEKLRKGAEEKSEAARVRMDELQEVHRRLVKERGEKAKEVERRRVRIEQTEKKVCSAIELTGEYVHADDILNRCKISKRTSKTRCMLRARSISRWRAISNSTSTRWSNASRLVNVSVH